MATIGVKVELEGAQAYKKNMSQVTSETKLYQAEVKKVSEQIKQGNNVFQNRIQKGKLLEKQLESQKQQEKLLSDEIARLSQEQGENSAAVNRLKTQYENLQTAMAKTQDSIKENGGVFGALSGQLDQAGSKMSSIGDTLSKTVTAGIVGAGAASYAAWTEVDNALDTVVKKTGATGKALENLQDTVKKVATSVPTDFETAGNAIGEVNTRFGVTGEALEDLSTKFIQFAELNGTDVSSSIDTVQSAMAAFGIEADKAGVFLDTLNKAGQDTGISVDALASSMTTNAAALKEMGYSASDSAFFIANLSKQGIDASAVMTGLKKALATASNDGKSMEEAMSELQKTMESSSSSTEAYQTAIELFGSRAGASIAEACQSGRLNFDELGTSMEDFAGNVEETFSNTVDPVDELQMHMNELKLIGADIAEQVMPLITQAMTKLGEVIKSLSEKWNSLSEGQQGMIIKLAGVAAIVGPILSIFGRLLMFISNMIPLFSAIGPILTGTLIPAIGGIVAAITPFLPIIAGVIAAITAVVLVVKNWGAITDWVSEKWTQFTTFMSELGENIKAKWSELWNNVKTVITTKTVEVVQKVYNLGYQIAQKFVDLKNQALTWGRDMIQSFIDGVLAKWEALKQTVANVAQSVKDFLGFSEPKEGPLSNFHTYGRDMMENYAESIKNAQYLVKDAVNGVALDVNAQLGNALDPDEVYQAIKEGASESTTRIVLNNREVTRALSGMGVVFNG